MRPMVTLFSLLLLVHSDLLAAELKGAVRDAETSESLPGANVYIEASSAEPLQTSTGSLPSPMSAPAATRSS